MRGSHGDYLGNRRFDNRRVHSQRIGSEGFYMKVQCGLEVRDRSFVRITLADHNPFDSEWVSYVCVRVPLNYNFHRFHLRQTSTKAINDGTTAMG